MIVEIWSDYACPFCYIGKRRFEAALEQFEYKDNVEVKYRSFELDPNASKEVDYDIHEMLANKYGMTREKAVEMNQNVTEQANSVGLQYQMDSIQLTNTFDAHRLTHLAMNHGDEKSMVETLFRAYFTESKNIGDHETLKELAVDAGLHIREAEEMLNSQQFADQVRADQQEASQLGVRGVPFFVFNRKYAVSGAQAIEVFKDVLTKSWDEMNVSNDVNTDGKY